FEPLASGPTSVVNRSRRNGTGNINQLVGDYTNPILKPEAAEVVKRHGEIMLTGAGYPDPRNQCTPQGVPYVFTSGGIQMLQQPDKIAILYDYDHQVRHVRMNQPHPSHAGSYPIDVTAAPTITSLNLPERVNRDRLIWRDVQKQVRN